ncbi:hypothetical protein Fmac_025695 [Flemingia macrophylla]|uniref:DEAD/DEAH-box helicase domain-containing protein n=1 Tax=Flemingia macrophylla TaxID=520843 RepID=A0ABD1LSY2_9FABA
MCRCHIVQCLVYALGIYELILSLTNLLTLHCFNAATYITQIIELKSSKDCASLDNKQSHALIGLMIGTPFEILQYIEEGSVVYAEIRYLVLDEVDCMLGSGLDPEILKILRPLNS